MYNIAYLSYTYLVFIILAQLCSCRVNLIFHKECSVRVTVFVRYMNLTENNDYKTFFPNNCKQVFIKNTLSKSRVVDWRHFAKILSSFADSDVMTAVEKEQDISSTNAIGSSFRDGKALILSTSVEEPLSKCGHRSCNISAKILSQISTLRDISDVKK